MCFRITFNKLDNVKILKAKYLEKYSFNIASNMHGNQWQRYFTTIIQHTFGVHGGAFG
jgi:hypothetical protein